MDDHGLMLATTHHQGTTAGRQYTVHRPLRTVRGRQWTVRDMLMHCPRLAMYIPWKHNVTPRKHHGGTARLHYVDTPSKHQVIPWTHHGGTLDYYEMFIDYHELPWTLNALP